MFSVMTCVGTIVHSLGPVAHATSNSYYYSANPPTKQCGPWLCLLSHCCLAVRSSGNASTWQACACDVHTLRCRWKGALPRVTIQMPVYKVRWAEVIARALKM